MKLYKIPDLVWRDTDRASFAFFLADAYIVEDKFWACRGREGDSCESREEGKRKAEEYYFKRVSGALEEVEVV